MLDRHNITITFFDYLCLQQSIPSRYKKIIRLYDPKTDENEGFLVKNIITKTKVLRYTYAKLIKKLPYEIKAKTKWINSFRREIEIMDWKKIFTLPKLTTLDSQTRIFQYKIIHRILPTNTLLHIYKIKDDPSCEKCPNVPDDIEHALHRCPAVLELWYSLADWLLPEIDLYPYINSENIIFGIYTENKLLHNTIILAIKRYIYINKCKNTAMTNIGAKVYLKHVRLLETNTKSQKNQKLQL